MRLGGAQIGHQGVPLECKRCFLISCLWADLVDTLVDGWGRS